MCQLAIEWLRGNDSAWIDDRHESRKRSWRELLPDALKTKLQLQVLEHHLSVCQCTNVPVQLFNQGFCCITRTDEEVSVVCETENAPADAVAREDGWRVFRVCGPLDFGLVGILAKISTALAEAEIPLFAISTYDTDYILVKGEMLERAIAELRHCGCSI
ncbi:MAG TPA: ACT domain-containing protein [Eggerthellaceae bacterium]|nr:ACT domain-containing protein [Eggerthellaceae bacterium]